MERLHYTELKIFFSISNVLERGFPGVFNNMVELVLTNIVWVPESHNYFALIFMTDTYLVHPLSLCSENGAHGGNVLEIHLTYTDMTL